MATATSVSIKHQGKKYDVEYDTNTTGEEFKLQLFSLTNVEPSRQKILIKGGQLKDDVSMGSLGLKKGQTIMMMGTSDSEESRIVRPKIEVKFVEDMTETERARHMGAIPAGLVNLGNTCYLNSTLQTLRAIPELRAALAKYESSPSALEGEVDLAAQMKTLFRHMGWTQQALSPTQLLQALRVIFPQFAEKARSSSGYAQQDAEEAWSQIAQQLRLKIKVGSASTDQGKEKSGENGQSQTSGQNDGSFIDMYMAGEFTSTMECDEETSSGDQKTVVVKEKFLKLDCHIDSSTNHLRDGILAALSEKLEKRSEVLGRDAVYTKKSKISRAPKYLTVHFVRFFWKRQTQKKAKIMRKVSFPQELDIVEFCSETLKQALAPVRDKVREIRKDEEDIERSRKRRKKTYEQEMADTAGGWGSAATNNKAAKNSTEAKGGKGKGASGKAVATGSQATETYKTDAEVDAEKDAALLAAKRELESLLDDSLRQDDGANQSGLYELRGVVTHQGASADSGHYTAYIKKSAPVDNTTGVKGTEDGTWWWFNDHKVSEVTVDKVEALAGGGESHSALILLYQAVALPTAAKAGPTVQAGGN